MYVTDSVTDFFLLFENVLALALGPQAKRMRGAFDGFRSVQGELFFFFYLSLLNVF